MEDNRRYHEGLVAGSRNARLECAAEIERLRTAPTYAQGVKDAAKAVKKIRTDSKKHGDNCVWRLDEALEAIRALRPPASAEGREIAWDISIPAPKTADEIVSLWWNANDGWTAPTTRGFVVECVDEALKETERFASKMMSPSASAPAVAQGRKDEVERLQKENKALALIAGAATDLIENIREHGMHDNWKATANYLRAYADRADGEATKQEGK